MNTTVPRVALTGNVALELIASYFRDAGYDVVPQDVALDEAQPDFVYDVTAHDAVLAGEVPGFLDPRMEKLSGCRYSADGIRAIVEEFAWQAEACAGDSARGPKKVLAVDADNTLWRGIISEDGVENVSPMDEFQRGLAGLRADGVVLVLVSKNDAELMARAPLRHGDFAMEMVNWAPKAGNLIEACRALNLSTDAVVFVDDNPFERAQMKAHLPGVSVAPWAGWKDGSPAAQRQLVRRLREYFFSAAGITAEDRLRAADYARQRAQAADLRRYATREDFLADLGLWVRPGRATEADLDRLAQMAGKTNQFNATTIRRTRADFAALLARPDSAVFVFRAGDRFGEQGLVCYVVVELSACRITDFVMSCRAMGRTLECFALNHVARQVGRLPAIDYVPTAKNAPFAEFLRKAGSDMKTFFKEAEDVP